MQKNEGVQYQIHILNITDALLQITIKAIDNFINFKNGGLRTINP